MAAKFQMDIVTPDRVEFSQQVTSIVAPGAEGYLGIMAGHLPLITSLKVGVLQVFNDSQEYLFAVSEGYMEADGDKVIILAEAAEMAERIDVQRALEAKRRAESRLLHRRPGEVDFTRAERSLQRAVNRLKVAEMKKVKA